MIERDLNSYHFFRASIKGPISQPAPLPWRQNSNNQQNSCEDENHDHKQDQGRGGEDWNNSNHSRPTRSLANDAGWIVYSYVRICRILLTILSDGRSFLKSCTVFGHSYPNGSNFTRGSHSLFAQLTSSYQKIMRKWIRGSCVLPWPHHRYN